MDHPDISMQHCDTECEKPTLYSEKSVAVRHAASGVSPVPSLRAELWLGILADSRQEVPVAASQPPA